MPEGAKTSCHTMDSFSINPFLHLNHSFQMDCPCLFLQVYFIKNLFFISNQIAQGREIHFHDISYVRLQQVSYVKVNYIIHHLPLFHKQLFLPFLKYIIKTTVT